MNVLITGGGSGLGEAITRMLAKDTKNTIYFTFSNSVQNAKNIELDCNNSKAIKCDFKKEAEVTALLNEIDTLGIDILINNAYNDKAKHTYFHKIDEEEFSTDFMHNIIPTIRITQSAINQFRRKKSGKIITILTSGLANVPPLGWSCYTANKAYLGSLVKSWANENIKFNITSNAVSPAFMQTNLTSEVDHRIIEQMIDNHPLKKLLTIEEVAETVLFLSTASSQINGVDILINHGINIK
ncbi:SDR family oxidoreductase [Arenibacter palladensis]|uniref:SDR family oxidoreductase n=1 Tax=Arenibacter palladensis TaxID=237373 RepID=UPI0026E316F3|nr:SDR family oxidoreductase [Arenibacter palladensis]MDO6605134.1 SDR family oxidoreductase [Arenibacter palladensis]